MQITLNIPDNIYNDLEKFNTNIETSIIEAIKHFTVKMKLAENDLLHKWIQTPVEDKNNQSDISENHDKYLYGFDK